jgi:hypothetical protein
VKRGIRDGPTRERGDDTSYSIVEWALSTPELLRVRRALRAGEACGSPAAERSGRSMPRYVVRCFANVSAWRKLRCGSRLRS